MKTAIHLISMPWAQPTIPAIQTACLKAYLDRSFRRSKSRSVIVKTHSPFFSIPYRVWGKDLEPRWAAHCNLLEYPYFLLYLMRFGHQGRPLPSRDLAAMIQQINASKFTEQKLTLKFLRELMKATDAFIEGELLPQLDGTRFNLVGFTLNYDQVYASLYCARALMDSASWNGKTAFIFGGMSAALPEVVSLMKRLGIPGYCSIGEGEAKLERITHALLALPEADARREKRWDKAIREAAPGIFHSFADDDFLSVGSDAYKSQFQSMEGLPLPDYREYFDTLERTVRDSRLRSRLIGKVHLPMEGSRGCFAHCDFCGFNYLWKGFRKNTPQRVLDDALRLSSAHLGIRRIQFMDNVCDTWAEAYADWLNERGLRIQAFMELRAHHPEVFWTKLRLAGVDHIQVGVEAIAPALLARIGKGTRVFQNVSVHKYFSELQIRSGANLITHHPSSTLEDVAETRRILEATPHLQPFNLSEFRLVMGSAWHRKLSDAEKRFLTPFLPAPVPEPYRAGMIAFGYDLPASIALPAKVREAWDRFRDWYLDFSARSSTRKPELRVVPEGGGLRILDSRYGAREEHVLEGDIARVYRHCHSPIRIDHLSRATGLPMERAQPIVDGLVGRKLMLKLQDHYLALATRPLSELIRNYLAAKKPGIDVSSGVVHPGATNGIAGLQPQSSA